MLGGVSEEQAAEAAHQQAENADDNDDDEKEVVEDGDGDGEDEAADGVDAMEDDDEQQVPPNPAHLVDFCNMCESLKFFASKVKEQQGHSSSYHRSLQRTLRRDGSLSGLVWFGCCGGPSYDCTLRVSPNSPPALGFAAVVDAGP